MAEPFNPYFVWLGIPPEEQPANRYRLLGVPFFVSNPDVIDNAADQRTAHLRTFQSSKNGKLAEQLLNEVAAARVCLLDAKRKAAYDQELRAKLAAQSPAPIPIATQPAASGSAIQRQPPRRPTDAASAPSIPMAAVLPQSADQWDDLLGKPDVKPSTVARGRSAKPAAAKRGANSRNISIGIAAGVVLIAAAAFGIYALNSPLEGTLVFDWPDRADVAVTVDNAPIEVPTSGSWEHNFSAGPHHIAAQRPTFKFATDVNLSAGQRLSVPPDWKPKAVLVLSWPAALRSGAVLKIDGRVQSASQHDPLEVPVEPGRHTIQITRPGFDPIGSSATVGPDGRELVSIAAPPAGTKLVFDWPADERQEAELTVDGSSRTIAGDSDSEPFALALEPGRHVVHITRRGFEPFNQVIELSAGTDSTIKPTWTPEQKTATAPTVVVDTPIPVETAAPQPVKKLPVPAAAEQERIAKQLNDLYKTSQPGPKDPAKAQELYDVAAKDGSSPAERYMLLMKGAEIAAAGGDLNLSLQGIDTLDADYEIDALEAKQKLLEKFIAAGKPDQVAIAIPTAEQLVDQAVAGDRYDIAIVLATSASKAVAKSKISTHNKDEERLARRRHDIRLLEPIYAAAKKAQETLKDTPADLEANLTVGRWLCFYKRDWTTGLPMLAKGSDEKLTSLAEQEIKAPAGADQQVQIADAWWDLAQKEAGIARDSLHLHAGSIYHEAMPNLTSALKKAAIEKRLAEIADLKPLPAVVAADNTTVAANFPLGQWVDVLRLIDTTRDHVAGDWVWKGGGLICEPARASRIAFPVDVDGGYDLEVEFTRASGDGGVATLLSADSRPFMLEISSLNGMGSGLMMLDGRSAWDADNPAAVRPGTIENGHRYRLLVSVRIVGADRASVDVSLDRKPFLPHWEGNPAALLPHDHWHMPNTKGLGIGASSAVTFHSARLRTISGHATLGHAAAEMAAPQVAPATPASDKSSGAARFPLGQWVDVLRLVDTTKHVVAGRWSRAEDKIKVESDNQSRIVIPVAVAGSYDLEIELNRHDGSGDLHATLPVGAHSCDISLGQDGHIGGLETVDTRRAFDENNPITARSPAFENDHTYHLLAKVRVSRADRASIDVSLDGKPYLPHWEGDPATLGVSQDWAMPTVDHLGLGAWRSQVTYTSVKLRMISGHATDDSAIAGPPSAGSPMNSNPPTIVKARWGRRKTWVDVTAVVKEAVAKGEVVYANSGFLKVDPTEGRKKQLQITFKLGETEHAANINEGDKWSQDDYENVKP